jgi:hypothetical protein
MILFCYISDLTSDWKSSILPMKRIKSLCKDRRIKERGVKALSTRAKLSIPFESLAESIKVLSLGKKYSLWKLLEEQIAQAEEDILEQDPSVQAEIKAARAEYQSGDYKTIDEYMVLREKRSL